MKENPRNYNDAAKLFLVIAAISAVMKVIKSLQLIHINSMLGQGASGAVLEIVFSVLVVVAIVFTLMRKRWGLIALLSIAVIKMFATMPIGTNISFAYHMGGQVMQFLMSYGLFFIAMCFKTDGLSGWVAMLASEEYVLNNAVNNPQK